MATAQDLNELRYIVHLTHKNIYSGRKHSSYLVEHWPEPELAVLVKDENSRICVFDSVYYSSEITHAKVYQSIKDAQRDTTWLRETRSEWETDIMPVHAKIFFVAGLGKDKWS